MGNQTRFSSLKFTILEEEEEELVFIPRFPPPYGSLKAAYNRLPFRSPQQTPCEVGGAERALRELRQAQGYPVGLMCLKAADNRLPILSPQQTPCEVGGAERALTGLLCKNSSKSAVTSPRSPSWLHVEEEWGTETGSPD